MQYTMFHYGCNTLICAFLLFVLSDVPLETRTIASISELLVTCSARPYPRTETRVSLMKICRDTYLRPFLNLCRDQNLHNIKQRCHRQSCDHLVFTYVIFRHLILGMSLFRNYFSIRYIDKLVSISIISIRCIDISIKMLSMP